MMSRETLQTAKSDQYRGQGMGKTVASTYLSEVLRGVLLSSQNSFPSPKELMQAPDYEPGNGIYLVEEEEV